jgi:hypothetical protein
MGAPLTTPAIGAFEWAAGGAVLVVALVVARTVGQQRSNRLLAILLTIEGLGQIAWGVHDWFGAEGPIAQTFFRLGAITFGLSGLLYLFLVRRLASPLARPLRSPIAVALGAILTVGTSAALVGWSLAYPDTISVLRGPSTPGAAVVLSTFGMSLLLVFGYSLATSISAWRRADPGTMMRKKAGAFALAFGVRDAFYVLALVFNVLLLSASESGPTTTYVLWPIATLVYAILLGFGILRLQLFDLDLKVKTGISRSTVAAIGIAAVLVAAKLVESYLNRALGVLGGAIAAGLVLFLTPRGRLPAS